MNLLRPSTVPETVRDGLPQDGFGMEWDIIYDEEIRMSEKNDHNPYIFIPQSEEEVGSGEGADVEGSGEVELYDGELHYEDGSGEHSGDGLNYDEGSADADIGQRRMDYADYESSDSDQNLSVPIEEEAIVDFKDDQGDGESMEQDGNDFDTVEAEEAEKLKLMDEEEERYQTKFVETDTDIYTVEDEEDLNEIVESLTTIDAMDLDAIENLNSIENMLTSILGNINLVNQQQYQTPFQSDSDPGEEMAGSMEQLTENNFSSSTNMKQDQVKEKVPSETDVQQHLEHDTGYHLPTDTLDVEIHLKQEMLSGYDNEPESEPEAESEPELETEPAAEGEPTAETEPQAEAEPEFESEPVVESKAKILPETNPNKARELMPLGQSLEKDDPQYDGNVPWSLEPKAEPWPEQQPSHLDGPQFGAQGEEVHVEANLKQAPKMEVEDEGAGKPRHALVLGPRPYHRQEKFEFEASEPIVNDLSYINNGALGENDAWQEPHNVAAVKKEVAVAIGEISSKSGDVTSADVFATNDLQNIAEREGQKVDILVDKDTHQVKGPPQEKQNNMDNVDDQYKEILQKHSANSAEQIVSGSASEEKQNLVVYGANKKPRSAGNEVVVRDGSTEDPAKYLLGSTKNPAKDGVDKAAKEATIANTLEIGRPDEVATSGKMPQKLVMVDKEVEGYRNPDRSLRDEDAKTKDERQGMFFLPAGHGLFFGFKLGEMEKTEKMRLEIFANNQIHTDIDSSTIELAL